MSIKNVIISLCLFLMVGCTATVQEKQPVTEEQPKTVVEKSSNKKEVEPFEPSGENYQDPELFKVFNPSGKWVVRQHVKSSAMDGIKVGTEFEKIWTIRWNEDTKEISISGDDGKFIYRGSWSGNLYEKTIISQRVSVFLDSRVYTANLTFDKDGSFMGSKTRTDNPEGYTAVYEVTGKLIQ